MSNTEDESLAWRRQVLEEATRLRSALKDAQSRRQVTQRSAPSPAMSPMSPVQDELEMFEESQQKLKKNAERLLELRRQVELESAGDDEAEKAQLAFLDMAQMEMERTQQRMTELAAETPPEAEPTESEPSLETTVSETSTSTERTFDEPEPEPEEESLPPPPQPPMKLPTAMIAAPMEIRPLDISQVVETKERSVSMDTRDEQTWDQLMRDAPPTSRDATARDSVGNDSEFAKPKSVARREEVTFELIQKEMHLTSSPLVFFNLACFHSAADVDLEVMIPICGYAVAGRLLCVMGPEGTNTSILRQALSEPPQTPNQREVNVADFTVRELVEVADAVLRPEYLGPSVSLLKHLDMENLANIQIGTCIQRGASEGEATLGTPRGSRNPEAPTPRNPQTPRFKNTGAGIQKAVLLMEDLVSILDAPSIFKVLKVLRKVAAAKRATVLITLSKPFERRGLFGLFDDALFFNMDGVAYFGAARRMKDYCNLIGHPCPANTHVTDHILTISNSVAKYHECPIKQAVDNVITEFTGRPKPQQTEEKPSNVSKSKSSMFKRNKKEKKEEDDMSTSTNFRARRLAQLLSEERRQQALLQKASEKLDVWRRLTELDSHIPKKEVQRVATSIRNFDAMVLELQDEAKRHRPSCFMNLACFLNYENPEKAPAAVIQPTCAYANEGQLLGVAGPSGTDAANLLASLKLGSENTMLTALTVRDTLRLSEFVRHREQSEKLDHSVELVMGKMMLSACSQEVIGTLIQRGSTQVPAHTQVSIGDQSFSTAVRSILILDRILELDAQSVFVVLKLLKRIASSARLAIVLMLDGPESEEGLFYLLDTFLTFTDEGVGYFGAARHLGSYLSLVGLPCPAGRHVTEHIRTIMKEIPPSTYYVAENNTKTPFTVRYSYSALARFNRGIIDLATKSTSEGGAASSRTFVPKSFRSKKTARAEEIDAITEKAELQRQTEHRQQMLKDEEKERIRDRDRAFEEVWRRLADSDSSKTASRQPLKAGLKSIVSEMTEYQSKPSLFFNLACFLPDAPVERVDMMQPICGYALVGRIVAIVGPHETNLSSFLRALSGDTAPAAGEDTLASARTDVRHRTLTVFELLKIAESSRTDRGSQPIHETTKSLMINLGLEESADCKIGTMIQRGVPTSTGGDLATINNAVPSIVMLDRLSESLDAQAAFVVLKIVKRIAAQAHLSVIVHLAKPAERRGLFSLVDDCIVFDMTGVTYFGPANRLADYLNLVGYPSVEGEHETDLCFSLLAKYAQQSANRVITDTTPPVRYKYSPLADYVAAVVSKYTRPSEKSEYDLQSSRASSDSVSGPGSTFVPKNTRNIFKKKVAKVSKEEERRRLEEEEQALRREELAARESEAERMRIAEADAESVWRRMMEQDGLQESGDTATGQ